MKFREFREIIALVVTCGFAIVLENIDFPQKLHWIYVSGGMILGGAYIIFMHFSAALEQAKQLEQVFNGRMQNLLKEFEQSANTSPPKSEAPVADHVVSLDDK